MNEAFKTVFAPSPSAVWTFGDVEFGTHSHSTVPGWARLRLQWRDVSLELMQQAKAKVLDLIDEMNARSDEFRLRVTTSLRQEDGESGGYLHDMVCTATNFCCLPIMQNGLALKESSPSSLIWLFFMFGAGTS